MNPEIEKEKKVVYILVVNVYLNGEKERYCRVYNDFDTVKRDFEYEHNMWLEDYQPLINKGRYLDLVYKNYRNEHDLSFSIYEKDNYVNNHIDCYISENKVF